MSSLPDDIVTNILSRLQVKDILRFRSVCKPWCKLFISPHFVKMHIQNSKLNLMIKEDTRLCFTSAVKEGSRLCCIYAVYDSLLASLPELTPKLYIEHLSEIDYPIKSSKLWILGSCNGVFCMKMDFDVFCVWNPSTREHKRIPTLSVPVPIYPEVTKYGFGCDRNDEDYKLVKLDFYDSPLGYDIEVNICSLRSDSWKTITNPPSYVQGSINNTVCGLFLNGALHWLAAESLTERREYIVSFDIGEETFTEIQKPKHVGNKLQMHMAVLEGCLCLCVTNANGVTIWMMKDYRVTESWRPMFTISSQQAFNFRVCGGSRVLHSFKNGMVLFLMDNRALVLYDPKLESSRFVHIRGIVRKFVAHIYTGSLVSPNLV